MYEYHAPYPTTRLDASATGRRRKYMEDLKGSLAGDEAAAATGRGEDLLVKEKCREAPVAAVGR